MSQNSVTYLDIIKLLVSFLTPITVLIIGMFINRGLKKLENVQWANRKIIEKRMKIFDEMAPMLNKLYCFYCWIGIWKDVSPSDVLEIKRELDSKVHINRYLLSEKFFIEYQKFNQVLFESYMGTPTPIKIISCIEGPYGNRIKDSSYNWDAEWNYWFKYDEIDSRTFSEILEEVNVQYFEILREFVNSIGAKQF